MDGNGAGARTHARRQRGGASRIMSGCARRSRRCLKVLQTAGSCSRPQHYMHVQVDSKGVRAGQCAAVPGGPAARRQASVARGAENEGASCIWKHLCCDTCFEPCAPGVIQGISLVPQDFDRRRVPTRGMDDILVSEELKAKLDKVRRLLLGTWHLLTAGLPRCRHPCFCGLHPQRIIHSWTPSKTSSTRTSRSRLTGGAAREGASSAHRPVGLFRTQRHRVPLQRPARSAASALSLAAAEHITHFTMQHLFSIPQVPCA